MDGNVKDYYTEKEARKKRLEKYADEIQVYTQTMSSKIIRELVEERHRQRMTQQEMANITGIQQSSLARFETGARIPTLTVLQKYAAALGKEVEIRICDVKD